MTIANHAVAALVSAGCCVKHARALRIGRGERIRYLKKSVYCALCYVGLGAHGTTREAWRAGQAAFLTTAFDVLTDWRRFEPDGASTFDALVAAIVRDPVTRRLAHDLYETKRTRPFANDGLDRGAPALRLILRVMASERDRARVWNLDEAGRMLQLADDLLDFEEDAARSEINCLRSGRAAHYVDEYLRRYHAGELRRVFGARRTVLVRVLDRAAARAIVLRGAAAVTSASRDSARAR